MKVCRECNTSKPLSEFNKGAGTHDRHSYCRKCQSVKYQEWQTKHRESERRRHAEWRAENRDHCNAEARRWRMENPERAREIARRKEYKRKGGGKLPLNAYSMLVDKYGERCLKCGSKDDLTIDHVTPIVLGGKSELENLQILCRSCNSSKSGRSSADYRPQQSQL